MQCSVLSTPSRVLLKNIPVCKWKSTDSILIHSSWIKKKKNKYYLNVRWIKKILTGNHNNTIVRTFSKSKKLSKSNKIYSGFGIFFGKMKDFGNRYDEWILIPNECFQTFFSSWFVSIYWINYVNTYYPLYHDFDFKTNFYK